MDELTALEPPVLKQDGFYFARRESSRNANDRNSQQSQQRNTRRKHENG